MTPLSALASGEASACRLLAWVRDDFVHPGCTKDVAQTLKKRAAAAGTSLSVYVGSELAKIAARPTNEEIVARLQARDRARGRRLRKSSRPYEQIADDRGRCLGDG